MCADECVSLMHVCVCVRQMARVPSTPMYERRSCRRFASLALRVCSVRGCVSSLRVCAVAACFLSAATGDQCCGPDGGRRRALSLTWEPPRRAHKAKTRHFEILWCFFFFFFFKSKVTAELKVIHRLTHCCFYCLIKDNLVFPKVLYYVLWVCLKTTLTQCVYMTLKKNELLCSPDYDRIFKMHVYTSV